MCVSRNDRWFTAYRLDYLRQLDRVVEQENGYRSWCTLLPTRVLKEAYFQHGYQYHRGFRREMREATGVLYKQVEDNGLKP